MIDNLFCEDKYGSTITSNGKLFVKWQPNDMGICFIPEGCEGFWVATSFHKELKLLFLPKTMKSFSELLTFIHCPNWIGINVDKDNPFLSSRDGVLFDKKHTLLRCPCGRRGEYEVPDGTRYIESKAFWCCNELKVITLPVSIKNIRTGALGSMDDHGFHRNTNLEKIRVPKGHLSRFSAMKGLKEYLDILEEYEKCPEWKEVARETIPADALAQIKSVDVIKEEDIPSNEYDRANLTLQVHLKDRGEPIYWPLSSRTGLKEGDIVDPKTIEQFCLACEGGDDIFRFDAKKSESADADISHSKYLFFDTETAGLPRYYNASIQDTSNWPHLVQLAWILTDEYGNELKRKAAIVYPDGFTILDNAVEVHGITTERAKREGWPLQVVLNEFMQDMDSAEKIVGHNVDFDINIVGAELYRQDMDYKSLMSKPRICTMKSSTDFCAIPNPNSYYGGYKWPSLSELYRKLFDRTFEDAHDALADISATKDCFFELRERGIV